MTSESLDPGWRPALTRATRSLVPLYGLKSVTKSAQDGLTAIRSILLSIIFALFIFVIALRIIVRPDGGDPGRTPYLIAGIGLISASVISWLVRRPLAAPDNRSLAGAWRTRFFVGLAVAEAAALLGFVVALSVGNTWVYGIGLAFALYGLWAIAPSRRNLARDQERIRARGSPLDLTTALLGGSEDAPE